jgi:hypothetical protein
MEGKRQKNVFCGKWCLRFHHFIISSREAYRSDFECIDVVLGDEIGDEK